MVSPKDSREDRFVGSVGEFIVVEDVDGSAGGSLGGFVNGFIGDLSDG